MAMKKMSKWKLTDERALMLGMGTTMFLLALVFLGFVALLSLFGIPWYIVAAGAVVVVVIHYFLNDRLLLSSLNAREVTAEQEPHLHALVERLAALADIPKPKIVAIMDCDEPNALAAGRNPKNAIVAVTSGLLERLDYYEVEAVLAHEMAHIRNRDIAVLNLAQAVGYLTHYLMVFLRWSFVVVGAAAAFLMAIGHRNVGFMIVVLVVAAALYVYMGLAYVALFLIQKLNNFIILALGRCREYAADRVGAEITGTPINLASALQKIAIEIERAPDENLQQLEKANAFLIIPAMRRSFAAIFLSTHPRPEKRIEKLRNMQRDLDGASIED